MDRYQRVEKPKPETPINENEIRITTQGRMRNYITYATTLFQEKGSSEIVLKAMGRAINKTVMIAELIKRRIVGLHQNTSIGSTDITDMWEPLEEGLLPLETTRHVSMITITLSKKELDTSSTGYQPPLPADQVKPWNEYEDEGGGKTSFRVRQGHEVGDAVVVEGVVGVEVFPTFIYLNYLYHHLTADVNGFDILFTAIYNGVGDYNVDAWDSGRGSGGRGRGRGRGRSFRGRGWGYGGQSGGYYDYGDEAPPAQVRGKFAEHCSNCLVTNKV
ncbi:hypothetical protein JRO89_XS08G0047700 [Xanthoceras sorbifolium]|uniref:DNA/RNA-binding protein Alba-like domain-containing protein n=1 Tax=Xanthoceras sorbifolium TaxID=99658 RepID=A0ABQ8HNP1_9ROSI|nr:hypothetical protein JRO89_XS08G0047700 [Xanthoceras sorbifolium]